MTNSHSKDIKIKTGINLHIYSITFPTGLLQDTDDFRISIQSFPEKQKQYHYFRGEQLTFFDQTFSLNITNITEEILLVFRKKNFIDNDPIIASAIIHANEFPKIPQKIEQLNLEKSETDIIKIDIFEPRHQNEPADKRKIIGAFDVKMSTTVPIPESKDKKIDNSHFPTIQPKVELFNKSSSSDENGFIDEPKYNSYTEYILF